MSVAQIIANSNKVSNVQSWTSILQHLSPDKLYINVYAVEERYGGPEEGGWYWNAYHPVQSILFDSNYWDGGSDLPPELLQKARAKKQEVLKELAELYGENNRDTYSIFGDDDLEEGDVYSILRGAYEVVFENHPAEYHPKERPYYC